jgi:uncharacterized protein with HEPN domain
MDKDNLIFLHHILESIDALENYTKNVSRDFFYSSMQLQDAIFRRIEIIGEASKNIDNEFKNRHIQIPWRDITDMRNLLVHEYFGIDKELIWQTIKDDLPELKKEIQIILNKTN